MFDVVCPRYDFTVLLSVGCTVGVLVALYIIFRLESYSGSPELFLILQTLLVTELTSCCS